MDTLSFPVIGDPRISVHRGVVIGPLLPGSGKRLVRFSCSPADLQVQHLRHLGDRGVFDIVERLPFDPSDLNAPRVLDEPTIYAGPLWMHFGHFVSECIQRLWPRHVFPELARAKLAFHWTRKPLPIWPAWAVEVLDLMSISVDDVLFIDRPTRFQELYLPVQGRILGGLTQLEDYDRSFWRVSEGVRSVRSPRPVHLYVSRSRQSGTYLGERIVERLLAEAGFAVIFPENERVSEMVALLKGARTIVFSEGSAIHNLELCGPIEADVFVVARRAGASTRFGRLVDSLANRSRIYEEVTPLVPLEWDISAGTPAYQHAVAVVDLPRLIDAIAEFSGIAIATPDPSIARTAVLNELASYLLAEPNRQTWKTTDEQLGLLLRKLRAQLATLNLTSEPDGVVPHKST